MTTIVKITKQFNAPIQSVWDAFTQPVWLKKWWAPGSMHCANVAVDLKEGGLFLVTFAGENGKKMHFRSTYQRVEAPNTLVYLEGFADENYEPVLPSHYGVPVDEQKPYLVTFEFESVDNKTQLTAIYEPHLSDDNHIKGFKAGWSGMMDKLHAVLEA